MLTVKNIFKKIKNKKILDDISFQVAPGEIVALVGSSGVGKSTILKILTNLEDFDHGSILLDGKPLNSTDVGMVFQDFNLFSHMTVLENITAALIYAHNIDNETADNIAIDLLHQFDMQEYTSVYPAALSGGQKQRVACARALALKPKVLCLDEPTSALDPVLKIQVAQLIEKLANQKIIVIIATHDIQFLQQLNATIILMDQGKIVQTAHSKTLKDNPTEVALISSFIFGKTSV